MYPNVSVTLKTTKTMTDTNKTIEERAREHAAELRVSAAVPVALTDIAESTYKCGAEDIMVLPLAACLTDSERERVRDYYEMAQSNSRKNFAGEDRYEQGAIDVLESIFGKELFNDNK